MSAFRRDAGMSTRVCLAVTALRIRDSMSAIGSVIKLQKTSIRELATWRIGDCQSPNHQITKSPTALGHPCDVAFEREFPEAQAAERELPHVGTRAAAQVAAVAQPDLELRLLLFFCNLGGCCHKRLFQSLAPTLRCSPAAAIQFCLNGMPMNCSSFRASWSVLAVVTTDTFMPRALSTFM